MHREAWIEREANSFREWNWFHAPGKRFWRCCRLISFQCSTGITKKPCLAHEKASAAYFKALEPCSVASYKVVSCIMKVDSADKFLGHDQSKASLLCASLQTRPRHWNSVHVKNFSPPNMTPSDAIRPFFATQGITAFKYEYALARIGFNAHTPSFACYLTFQMWWVHLVAYKTALPYSNRRWLTTG